MESREELEEADVDDGEPEFSAVRTNGETKLVAAKAIIADSHSKPRGFQRTHAKPSTETIVQELSEMDFLMTNSLAENNNIFR